MKARRTKRPAPPTQPAKTLSVAQVAVDVPLPHLDRTFDYLVTARQDAAAVPGCRVRVRFAGQLVDGFLLDRVESSAHPGRLTPLGKVVSSEPVLTPDVLELSRAVAERYAGTLSDVLRLAIPPRHASVEKAEPRHPDVNEGAPSVDPLPGAQPHSSVSSDPVSSQSVSSNPMSSNSVWSGY
ncbi:MAG TPA: primosome assembly protein PriA, partial [Actinomycetes bacterium]|nr:primosome assembly protein PriA [Actinomycetes bacterium]